MDTPTKRLLPSALLLVLLASCRPPPLTKEVSFGMWQGQDSEGQRLELTFINPDVAELKRPDEKDAKVIKGKWSLGEGKLSAKFPEDSWTFRLKEEEVAGEPRLKLIAQDGKAWVMKL